LVKVGDLVKWERRSVVGAIEGIGIVTALYPEEEGISIEWIKGPHITGPEFVIHEEIDRLVRKLVGPFVRQEDCTVISEAKSD